MISTLATSQNLPPPPKKVLKFGLLFNLFTTVPWVGLTQIILFVEFLIKIQKTKTRKENMEPFEKKIKLF
jgi:hypothetical protein